MKRTSTELQVGDFVEVKSPDEILLTLDSDGTLNQLPFMPEMLPFCGKKFRIARRAFKTCNSGTKMGSNMRGFKSNDVVILEGLRCSGVDHDGCQKSCMIFWRDAWLRKVANTSLPSSIEAGATIRLRARLKTKSSPETYFCQASEILHVTNPLSRNERFSRCFDDLRAGNCTPFEMARRISIWLIWKAWRILFGPYGRGNCEQTPAKTLNLGAGEQVIVESMANIRKTLDDRSCNRGLWFSPDMRLACGQERTVDRHLEKIIVDGTGEMRVMRNTVYLKDSYCSCPHVAFGGCPRGEYVYWREIWLQRKESAK